MYTVSEMSRLSGVSVRTLHHYDHIGLLRPVRVMDNGYRLYDDAALQRLHCILLYRELGFSLRDVARMMDSPDFDRREALQQQIALLEMHVQRLTRILDLARIMERTGVDHMNFDVFDNEQIDRYAREAEERWGQTDAWKDYARRSKGRSRQEEQLSGQGLMQLLAQFHALRELPPDADAVQAQVKRLQEYITSHFYTCTRPVLQGLGEMYAAPGEMHDNIDRAGGEGTADFAAAAIAVYCRD